MNTINNLIRGNILFQRYHISDFKEDLDYSIKNGQKPDVLLISCCDSRVTTDFMFGNKPGDLFVLRNIGNFVPVFNSDKDFSSISSAIEYAVNILGVTNIIVCGHSYCGACESLYNEIPKENTNIIKWLEIAKPVKEFTLKKEYATKQELYRATEKNSIVFQMKNLLTYPIVRDKFNADELKIHGWYYNLDDGSLSSYCDKDKIFQLLTK